MRDGTTVVLIVLHFEIVADATLQSDGAGRVGGAFVDPRVNDELVVDPKFHAVIGVRHKVVQFGILRLHLAGPTHGVEAAAVGDGQSSCAPGEINVRVHARQLQIRGIEVQTARISGTRVRIILAGQPDTARRGGRINDHAGIARGADVVAGAGEQFHRGVDGNHQVGVGQRSDGDCLRGGADRKIQRARHGGVIHVFGREAAAGAAEREVRGDGRERETAARDGEHAEVDRALVRIGFVGGGVGGGDGQEVLRGQSVGDIRVVVHRLAEAVHLGVAESVGGVQAEHVFLPVVHAVAVGIHVADGDAEKFCALCRGSLKREYGV